jgi:hypothetical protein
MIFSDLAPPAEASGQTTSAGKGFAQAGNRYPLFGIMLCFSCYAAARASDCSAASAASVLITSAYFSDMSNRLTACDTWLRS